MLATAAFNFKRMMNKWKKKFFHFFQTLFLQFETFEKRKDFLVTFFFITKGLSLFLVIASPFLPVIASSFLSVIARSEATKQSPLTLHPVIANRRVGKCAGVKQSPRCTFLLVLGILRRLLRSLRSLAMTLWGYRLAMTQ